MDITYFIPEAYAAYRRAVGDAFTFFLDRVPHLEPFRCAAGAGSRPATLNQVLAAGHASPMLHKLAQVLARNRHLAPELRVALQSLESHEPRTAMADVLAVVREELGEAASELRIAPAALAEASVAVALPFEHGPEDGATRGVLKVLKPGVRQRLEQELAVWSQLGDYFNERCVACGLPDVEYGETFDMVADLLRNEIDLAGEQAHLAEAAHTLRDIRGVIVPELLPFCTAGITAMRRVDGRRILPEGPGSPPGGATLARRLVDALIAQPLFSAAKSAMFHADPHAGNLMITAKGELAILDWALAGRLSIAERESLAQIVLGAILFDAARICRGIEGPGRAASASHGAAAPGSSTLRTVVDRRLDEMRGSFFPSVHWMCGLLDDAVLHAKVRFSKDLLLFRKSLLMLEGVVADLGGDLDAILRSSAMTQLVREWPIRGISPPATRAFGIRLSNLELAAAGWAIPVSVAARLLHVGH